MSGASLGQCEILVIANALGARNVGRWERPVAPAFTPAELRAVTAWVWRGGRLLLIADHMPFAGAAAPLAAAFGLRFLDGFALRASRGRMRGVLRFSRADGTLTAHPVVLGRDATETVDHVTTFTGQAFRPAAAGPDRAADPRTTRFWPLLVLGPGVVSMQPRVAWRFTRETPTRNVAGWWQGAVAAVGRGRLAVFGEAAMFTAQRQCRRRVRPAGTRCRPIGMNHPQADQNAQFVLNLLHWLAGLLPDTAPGGVAPK